jgi:hypothetical protein
MLSVGLFSPLTLFFYFFIIKIIAEGSEVLCQGEKKYGASMG